MTLSDGTVLAMQGHPRVYPQAYDEVSNPADWPPTEEEYRHDNSSPDRYYPNLDYWVQLNPATGLGECFLGDPQSPGEPPQFSVFFPRVFVLPSGKLFIVQPLYTTPANASGCSRWGWWPAPAMVARRARRIASRSSRSVGSRRSGLSPPSR